MFTKNQITLIGNLGRDAETRFTTANVSVTTFSMVTENSYKNKDGDWVKDPTWHRVTMFDLSDYHKDNLKKGQTVHVEGRQTHREYTDKDGVKRYSAEVIGNKRDLIIFNARRSDNAQSESTQEPVTSVENNDDLPF